MSTWPVINRAEAIEWLKGSGLLVLTILGILLYIVLSVPANVFYARLGVTPDEAGLSYTNLLSGSTVEILAILIVLTSTFLVLSFALAFASVYFRAFPAVFSMMKSNSWWQNRNIPYWKLDDHEYEERLKLFEDTAARVPELVEFSHSNTFAELEAKWRRTRELQMLGVRTVQESAELDVLDKVPDSSLSRLVSLITRRWIKHWGRFLVGIYLVTTIFIVLPSLAFVQAGDVLGGHEYVGHQLGLFNYRAELVGISATSQAVEKGMHSLVGQSLFLLGQNSEHVILYSPATHSTVRLPTMSVIVTNVR